jgi:hypothetical protein
MIICKKAITQIQPFESVITDGLVTVNPFTIQGGHVLFTIKDTTGTISLTSPVAATLGGTGLTSFASANLAIYSTSTTALTAGVLPVAAGGTGLSTLTANAVLVGNGTGTITAVSPGANGNVLKSNGTIWTSGTISSTGFQNIATITASGTTAIPSSVCKITVIGGGGGAGPGVDNTTNATGGRWRR